MNITTIPATPGARRPKRRLGRGIGSGRGKTATRGQNGQRSRTGSSKRPGFEGGRTPLIRRVPKRGMIRKATGTPPEPEIVNVRQLNRVKDGEHLTLQRLVELHLIRDTRHPVKLLGDGTLSKRVTITVHRTSETAKAKVVDAGGSVELIDN